MARVRSDSAAGPLPLFPPGSQAQQPHITSQASSYSHSNAVLTSVAETWYSVTDVLLSFKAYLFPRSSYTALASRPRGPMISNTFNKTRWRDSTPYLWYCAFFFAWGNILFGIDTGSFGSIQSLPSFLNDFGTKQPDGSYALSTTRKAIMNSIVWPGKLIGAFAFEPLVQRVGYKNIMYICCVLQAIAITIEMTSKEWIQFSFGRILAYLTTGIIENAVPAYQAEIAPPALRGFFAGSIISLTTLGNMWGAGMGRALANNTTDGWRICVGVQYIPAVVIAITIPFTIESPRWLITHGRKDQALRNLNRIRPKHLQDGSTEAEINAIALAYESDDAHQVDSGSWFDLFRGSHLSRTVIASLLFFFQQTCGSQFVNSYSPTFFQSMGLGTKSFTYSFLAQVVGFVAATMVLFVVDKFGRRPVLIVGMLFATLFNFLVAGFGQKKNPTADETNTVIASLILLNMSNKFSASTLAYLVTAEIGGVKLRKKTMSFATAIDVLSAFVITFTLPYLLGDPVYLKAGVGWIMGGNAFLAVIVGILFVPELTGRSLEEVDELFEAKLWGWQFKNYHTSGIGQQIAQAEGHEIHNAVGKDADED